MDPHHDRCRLFFQDLRSALQKHLKGRLGTTGATFVRFGYGFPFATAYVAFLHLVLGHALPTANIPFALASMAGGLAQIFATFLLVHLFSYRNFAVGTAYSKIEPVQAAIFGLVILGETITLSTTLAIVLGVAGVIVISTARQTLSWRTLVASLIARPALIGLTSAALFGASAVCYRAASLSLGGPDYLMKAAFTLGFVTVFQTAVMGIWMRKREPCPLAYRRLGRTRRRHRIRRLVRRHDAAEGSLCADASADRTGLHLRDLRGLGLRVSRSDQPQGSDRLRADRRLDRPAADRARADQPRPR